MRKMTSGSIAGRPLFSQYSGAHKSWIKLKSSATSILLSRWFPAPTAPVSPDPFAAAFPGVLSAYLHLLPVFMVIISSFFALSFLVFCFSSKKFDR